LTVAIEEIEKKSLLISLSDKPQCSLKKAVSFSGVGLFTGTKVTLTLRPAEIDTGIVFQRVDLPGKPFLPATIEYMQATPRCTLLGKDRVIVQTVEHLLAALSAFGIDNLCIEIDGPEIPIEDGSAKVFVEMIEKGGLFKQRAMRQEVRLLQPLFWSQEDVHLVALPAEEYRISYTLNYPHSNLLGAQFYSSVINEEHFRDEIAPARTFSLYEDLIPLLEKGLLKGGTLDNGVVIKEEKVMNPEGLRFKEEMARHKILDLVGDLSLIGVPLLAHIIAIRSGHYSNSALAKLLTFHITREKL